jgi:chromosome segregation ATPase
VFATSLAFPPGALAGYQDLIAAFTQKQAIANGVLADLNIVVECLGQQEAKLQARDKELEGIIGYLATEENKQAVEVSRLQAAYNDFALKFQAAERDFRAKSGVLGKRPDHPGRIDQAWGALHSARNTKNAELNNLRRAQGSLTTAKNSLAAATAERHAKEGELTRVRARQPQLEAESRSRQLAYEGYRHTFDTQQYEIYRRRNHRERLGVVLGTLVLGSSTSEAERTAAENLNQALSKLQQSQLELNATRVSIAAGAAEIARIEHEIGRLKAALSDLRAEIPPYQQGIDEFANTIEEARRVDLEHAGARTARKLVSLAATIDAAMARSNAAIQHVNSVLPAGWMAACTKP